MTVTTRSASAPPPVSAEVAALASIPAGPELVARLAAIQTASLTGFELPLVLAAWSRVHNHAEAQVHALVGAVIERDDPSFGYAYDPDDPLGGGGRLDFAGATCVRGALVVSGWRASRMCSLIAYLRLQLPMVLAAWQTGGVDRARVEAFITGTVGLSVAQQQAIATRLLPTAGSRVLRDLLSDIVTLGIEADPAHAERMNKVAVKGRRLRIGVNSVAGVGDLLVRDAPADLLAVVGQRLDAIGWRTKREAIARQLECRLDNVRTDLATHLLAGLVGNDDEEIVEYLLGLIEAENAPEAAPADGPGSDVPGSDEPTAEAGAPTPADPADPVNGRATVKRPSIRRQLAAMVAGQGLRVRLGLLTLAGLDDHAGRLVGQGVLLAGLCRRLATAPHAVWRLVCTDASGLVIGVETLQARPGVALADGRGPGEGPAYRQVEILLTVTPAELAAFTTAPPVGWESVAVEVAALASGLTGAPNGDPFDRFPSARLRRFIEVRDETCRGVYCTIGAHRCDCDHTIEVARGGLTLDPNLGMLHRRDHGLKDYGWTLLQVEPGVFEWISPLGHRFRVGRPEPLDLTPIPADDTNPDYEPTDEGWRHHSCLTDLTPKQPPPRKPPKPPPPPPAVDADDDQPPF